MKNKHLQPKRALRTALLVLLLSVVGIGKMYALYDFSAVCPTGQTLYYNIIDATHRYVELTYPGSSSSNSWNGYTEPTGNITLPSTVTYNGINYAVKRIGEFTFRGCSGLSGSLSIPSSVTEIGNYAFHGCYHFTGSLTIPNSVTMIGKRAFYNCFGFKGTLTIGSNVTTIGEEAFSLCNGFTGSLTIPNSVTSIGASAFYTCHGFNGSLTLGNSLAAIGGYAFYRCNHLTGSLTIPSSVTTIGSGAFGYCSGFTGMLTIPNSVTSIGLYAFYNCTGITHVYYDAINCADVPPGSQGDHYSPFNGCGGSLSIGDNVLRIPAYMFYECSLFEGSLVIPNSVTVIGEAAFNGFSGFTGSLSLGNSLTTIGHGAFYGCSGLTGTLTIPNSVGVIDHWAFYYCSGFTGALTIPSSVTSIGICAFEGCSGFTSMTVSPETPPTLGTNAFNNVPKTIPVYVSCSAMDAYQSASGWSAFTNYQCSPEVTVTILPTDGGTVTGEGTYSSGTSVTVTATPSTSFLFLHWSKNGEVVSCNPSYTFTVNEDTDLEAVFMRQLYAGDIIGEGTSESEYLPSYSYYKYALTQQIYTPQEIGGSKTITSISFFNVGDTETRIYDIYLKQLFKSSFTSPTDWVTVNWDDPVFSGTVTMRTGMWTTIVLDEPFNYTGNSNLILIIDDNTGGFTYSPHMSCRTYSVDDFQSLYVYSDNTNYSPIGPSYTGTRMKSKNQIMLNGTGEMCNINAVSANTTAGTVSGGGQYNKGNLCRLKATANSGYTFIDWSDDLGVVVSTDANYSFFVNEDRSLTANFMADDDDMCSLTFDLHDSWGDGWNGNQLVVNYGNGMTKKFAVPSNGRDATFTLPVADGDHVELSWIEGSWVSECSFEVSYTDGNLICFSSDLEEGFQCEFDMDCAGQSSALTYLGDHSKANSYYLPSYSYYKYSLSEQIYTADEIGVAGTINGMAFYNNGTQTKIRDYAIYLRATAKTAFESTTDWISTNGAIQVFSGSVTMKSGKWTPIVFDTPFEYDGTSNLVLIVDDNTGDYTGSPHMSCLVYPTEEIQTLRIYSDGTDYNPNSPSSYTGTLMNVKNQIMLDIMPSTVTQTIALTSGWNWFSTYLDITLDDLKASLVSTGNTSITIKSKNQNTYYQNGVWRGNLNFDVAQMYKIYVNSACEITLEGTPIDPSEHSITIHNGPNWIGFPLSESMTLDNAFAGFAVNGDVIKSKGASANYTNGHWRGAFNLEPGQGYIYNSNTSGDRILIFPSSAK